ncbi:aldo/keto reductase [Gigaspora rosea]|uniref:Aldo/keto reductase n=1 Tax=Gigaspora rosea TaxID=44941 RepID=A0A397U7Y3_9GLOM|nr:aldo/keto reductase [Gigaspora rosea]
MIPVIGLGCIGMSEFYGSSNEEENLKVLNRSIDIKCTFWDTADMYGSGKNEILLSKVLKDRRNEVFLCTKFGNVRGVNGEYLGVNGTPEYVHEACEKSLQRLGVDCIDLYYQHRVDKNVPIEDTVRAMAELFKQGKVKYLGLSECSANTLRRAYKIHPIAAVQMEYSPWSLDIETNRLKEACEEFGVTIVAYSPLGRGILSGKYKSTEDFEPGDSRKLHPRYVGENFAKNLELVREIEKLAKNKGVTSSQLCLAWILAQGENIVAIPGTKKIKYLEENFQTANINLTSEELAEIRKIINSEVIGDRYSEEKTKAVTNRFVYKKAIYT